MKVNRLSRRRFLRTSGVLLALPLLDSAQLGAAAPGRRAAPRRLIAVTQTLGMHGPLFFPEKPGRDYSLSPYLEPLKEFRDDFTVFSGVSHPQAGGGHQAAVSFLTGAQHAGTDWFRNSISLDQLVAERMKGETRFPSLSAGFSNLSWTRFGVQVPAEASAARLYARLFLAGSREEQRTQLRRLRDGQSIMDNLRDGAKRMQKTLGKEDREKLDDYFESVREVEQRLHSAEQWARKPKPRVSMPQPGDIANSNDIPGKTKQLIDVIHLALLTDSTRVVTLSMGGMASVLAVPGVTRGWHDLSHHGNEPGKIAELRLLETAIMKTVGYLLGKLKGTREAGESLLDRTSVLFGSNMGNASSHDTANLPILLAGGGFKHGAHLAFDRKNNTPLCNLYLSMLHRLGLDVKSFGTSTGTIRGLDMKAYQSHFADSLPHSFSAYTWMSPCAFARGRSATDCGSNPAT
jgi:hypothetical protein